jgi:hypothetical protein
VRHTLGDWPWVNLNISSVGRHERQHDDRGAMRSMAEVPLGDHGCERSADDDDGRATSTSTTKRR